MLQGVVLPFRVWSLEFLESGGFYSFSISAIVHCSLSVAQLFGYFLSMSPFKHFDFSLSLKVLKTYQEVKCILPGPQCVQTDAVVTLPGTCKFLKLISVDTAFNTVSASGR